jgi:hypothetical protein
VAKSYKILNERILISNYNYICFILHSFILGLFGILICFLLGIYRREYEIKHRYLFFWLLLLHILSHNEFDDTFLRNLSDSSLAPNIAEPFENVKNYYLFTLNFIVVLIPSPTTAAQPQNVP